MHTGQLIAGRYRLKQPIGSGGMGIVWRAVDEKLRKPVAVKRGWASGLPHRLGRRISREARIAGRLNHPHVVTLLDVVSDGEDCWLVMEYVAAPSLATVLGHRERLPPAEVAAIGAQVAEALEAVHAAGVVHRDVKPGNVLVGPDGTVKLADFGIARAPWADTTATMSGLVGGTPAYLAPEVANGLEPSAASDVFSLGATLYAAAEGDPPFGSDENPLLILRRAVTGAVPPPQHAGALAPVLTALLDPDPERRPDAARARRLLREHAGERAGGPVAAPGARRRLRRSALVAVPALVAVTAVALVMRIGGQPPAPAAQALPPPPTSTFARPSMLVPSVVGLSDRRATARIDAAGLDVRHGTAVFDSKHRKGVVVRQRPAPGSAVYGHRAVVLVLSKGAPRTRVPGVVGTARATALSMLAGAHLRYAVTEVYDGDVPAGRVVRTSPGAGALVAPGSTVRVYVSKGSRPTLCDKLVRTWLPHVSRQSCRP
ncbi:MAG TPA: protein kinase [Streptosporangiales bacterium]